MGSSVPQVGGCSSLCILLAVEQGLAWPILSSELGQGCVGGWWVRLLRLEGATGVFLWTKGRVGQRLLSGTHWLKIATNRWVDIVCGEGLKLELVNAI